MSHATAHAPADPLDRRTARRALRTEKAQLEHWRRLLRARLDLAVAAFTPPEPLGTMAWDLLPEAGTDLPPSSELAAAVAPVTPLDPIELMTRLRDLDRTLARYSGEIDEALERSTDRVVEGLAARVRAAGERHRAARDTPDPARRGGR